MKNQLSKVYLDDYPIELMGDEARPPLSRIVRAGGKIPARVTIVWLESRSDVEGKPLDIEEVVDRTVEPTKPIYLRSRPRQPDPGEERLVGPGPSRGVPPPAAPEGPVVQPDPDPVISQLGKPPITEKDMAASHRAADRAAAEAAAEERQEEQRNEEDLLSDEMEAREDERDDRKASG